MLGVSIDLEFPWWEPKLLAALLHVHYQAGFHCPTKLNSLALQTNLHTPETKAIKAVTHGDFENHRHPTEEQVCLLPGRYSIPQYLHSPFLIFPLVPGTLGMSILYLQQSESCVYRGCIIKHESELLCLLILKTQGFPPSLGQVQSL